MFRPAPGLLLFAVLSAPACAAYTFTPLSGGANQRNVAWGGSFDLDIVITSNVSDTNTSAIFQVRFTQPGLVLADYQWSSPYQNGGIFDDSTPAHASLPLPIVPTTLEGGLYPPGLNDLEMSNVLIGSSFGVGSIARLSFTVPLNYGYTGPIFISVNPDQIANGFTEIESVGGQVFRLDVAQIPAPSSATALFLTFGAAVRRRR